MPELFLYLLSIISFCASPSYCLLPLAYQSVSSRLCQLSFQALWPSSSTFSVSDLFLFSSLSLSSHWHFSFSCLFLPLSRSLYHQLPPPPPSHYPPARLTHTHTLSLFPHSYSTCVSLLGVAWGNQIHLQIHLFILLIPTSTQGLILFSILLLSVVFFSVVVVSK